MIISQSRAKLQLELIKFPPTMLTTERAPTRVSRSNRQILIDSLHEWRRMTPLHRAHTSD